MIQAAAKQAVLPMKRRRVQVPSLAPKKPFSGRRIDRRRTSQDNVRVSAAWVVERTLASRAPSQEFLLSALARCDEQDHGLLRELSLGTLRWLRRLDSVLSQASHRPLAKVEPALLAPLRVAAYQLLFLDRVPHHAVVSEGVEHARRLTHRGGASFTNAVLRRIARQPSLDAWPVQEKDPIRRLAIEKSHPDFLVRRWVERLGRQRAEALLDANNRPKSLQLLAFRDRGGREMLAEALIDEGIAVDPSALSPVGLIVRQGNPLHSPSFLQGAFYLQDEASQAAALIPPPRPGERILDAAAAPGGKGFTLLAAEPTTKVFLADVSVERLHRLRQNVRRLDRRLPILVADAGASAISGGFDRIILDLPCSGTGTLRKNPELKWRISDDEIGRLRRQSLRLMEGMAPQVRPGGYLVVITCSLEPEENELVVERFLHHHPIFHPLPLEEHLRFPLSDGIFAPGGWRMMPAGQHDGFTVHVLQRAQTGSTVEENGLGGGCGL